MSSDELKKIRLKVQIGVTAVLGLFCMAVIFLKPGDDQLVKWGYWNFGNNCRVLVEINPVLLEP